MSCCKLQDAHGDLLVDWLRGDKKLERFSVRLNNLTSATLGKLLEVGLVSDTLRYLDVSMNAGDSLDVRGEWGGKCFSGTVTH